MIFNNLEPVEIDQDEFQNIEIIPEAAPVPSEIPTKITGHLILSLINMSINNMFVLDQQVRPDSLPIPEQVNRHRFLTNRKF